LINPIAVQVRSEIAAVQIPTASPNPSIVTELPNKYVVYTLIPARYQNTRGRPTYFQVSFPHPGEAGCRFKGGQSYMSWRAYKRCDYAVCGQVHQCTPTYWNVRIRLILRHKGCRIWCVV